MPVNINNNGYKVHFGIKNFAPKNILKPNEIKLLNEYKTLYDYSGIKPAQWKLKRVFDVGVSTLGLAASAPVLLLSALAIKINSKGPVLFKQERVGQNGKTFIIYKLRTMNNNAALNANVHNPNDERITKVGKILRKFSIDEFPQFFNIIKGDMSLVGPRPLDIRSHKIRNTGDEFVMRYIFKPGASLEYQENVKHYVDDNPQIPNLVEQKYIRNWSLKEDIKVCLKTLKTIICGDNY